MIIELRRSTWALILKGLDDPLMDDEYEGWRWLDDEQEAIEVLKIVLRAELEHSGEDENADNQRST